jgi:hypothetical protein
LFKKDDVKIVGEEVTGKFDIIGYDIVKSTSNYIEKVNQYINRFVIESDFDLEDVDVAQTVTFTDMDIDDQTDFDTIYEFLDIFEKIAKSNNSYDISLSSKYSAVGLKFLRHDGSSGTIQTQV